MSVFAEYNVISKSYDGARLPNGAHHYLGLVYSLTKKTAENLHLLDMGCGTGNHALHLLQQGLGKATLFDANATMLEHATTKLKSYIDKGQVTVEQHILPNLPYDDDTFDVVMCNQVFQHLTELHDKEYTNIQKAIKEAYRVLKPNGVFLVNLCTPFQTLHAFWYGKLYPESNNAFAARVVEPKKFLSMLRKVGFQREGMVIEPLDVVYAEERYFKEDGPLYEEWRNVDSMSASLSKEELERATKQVLKLKEEGKLKEFMEEADSMRENVGQFAIYYAKKV